MNRNALNLLAFAGVIVCASGKETAGQGLILSLPKDGAWVRFEGTVKQVELRPDAPEGDISMDWIEHLTIKSVGSEEAVFKGRRTACRWIEIKVVTGKPSESGVEAGPVGERIYKILVPEPRVVGVVDDGEKIPFSFLDIVKGVRKIGNAVTPIPLSDTSGGAFQVFPLISPLMHYEKMEASGSGEEEIRVAGGAVRTRKFKAKRVIESPTLRTTNEAEIWRCQNNEVPFGLVRWTTKTSVEKKDSTAPRSKFKAATQSTVEMSAHESGNGAKSEIASK